MSREEAYVKLNSVFCEVFDVDEIHITDETTADQVEGWDSFAQINLFLVIEEEFDISFSLSQIAKFKNVGEMMDMIMSSK